MKHDGTDIRLYVLYDSATGIEVQTTRMSDREADQQNRSYQSNDEPFRWLLITSKENSHAAN